MTGSNTHKNIDTLNDVTKTLIDSQKGYQTAYEITEENYALRSDFMRRASNRSKLITEFQEKVRRLGGEPQESGGITGAAHRGWTNFSSMFQKDEKAALSAIDDGEEHLADEIEKKLKSDELDAETQALLRKAHMSAADGERFADRMEDTLK